MYYKMNDTVPEKKKRGRKKQVLEKDVASDIVLDIEKPPPKKRGRKPKGGKIVQNNVVLHNITEHEPNIILHLKCSLDDIKDDYTDTFTYNPEVESIQSYNYDKSDINNFLLDDKSKCNTITDINVDTNTENANTENNTTINTNDNMKNIWKKISSLKIKLHKNNISDKRSACFWCTHEFDNPPMFIPKNIFKDVYQVYGCFCSPECGVAYLMNEKIDTSVKFERYHLMNNIYCSIYNYTKNIKPAPDPYYLLEKYYGNLSIIEYRKLCNTDQVLIVVDKPLTHIFPEMYEDNSDFILNNRTIPTSNTFKLKRKPVVKKQY